MDSQIPRVPGFYDMHCHTYYSRDSEADPVEILACARERHILGVAFTDHCETRHYPRPSANISGVRDSNAFVRTLPQTPVRVFSGVEMAGYLQNPEVTARVLDSLDADVLLGTQHGVFSGDFSQVETFARVDFSAFDTEELYAFLRYYYETILETVTHQKMDILAHFSLPARYVIGKYGLSFDLGLLRPQTDAVLAEIIRRGIALEVNTSGMTLRSSYPSPMPDRPILERYRAMGGRLITLGSDAHDPDRIGIGFCEAWQMLRQIGFTHLYYYENRIPKPYIPDL